MCDSFPKSLVSGGFLHFIYKYLYEVYNLMKIFEIINSVDRGVYYSIDTDFKDKPFHTMVYNTSADVYTKFPFRLFGRTHAGELYIDKFDCDVTSMRALFWYVDVKKIYGMENIDTSRVASMDRMFFNSSIEDIDMKSINTKSLIYIDNIFRNCTKLSNINIFSWDTRDKKECECNFAFAKCNITGLDLSSWKVDNIVSMIGMFLGCTSLTTLNLSSWHINIVTTYDIDLSKGGYTDGMFEGCNNLKTIIMRGCDEHTIEVIKNALTFSKIFDCKILT